MNVGDRIKELRLQKNISVNKLANIAGISQSYLRDIELGRKQPTIEYMSYICDALGITLEKFFSDEKNNDTLENIIKSLPDEQKESLIKFLNSFI